MTENTVLPLINTAFEPGNARKAAESFADRDFREIAIAEFYYFTGQAQKCSDLVEIYIMSSRLELKLSACMLYVTLILHWETRRHLNVALRLSGNV